VVSPSRGRRTDAFNRRRWEVGSGRYAPTRVLKVKRQGMFDNVHVAPMMLYKGVEAFMAPICQHDCLHLHRRWGESYPDLPLRGWEGGLPYQRAGAPMIPENQSLRVSASGSAGTYHPTAENVRPGKWQIFMHHGTGYAVELTLVGQGALALEITELANPTTDFAALYYHNRKHEAGGASRTRDIPRLDELGFPHLEAL
jgi:hypothetical protein